MGRKNLINFGKNEYRCKTLIILNESAIAFFRKTSKKMMYLKIQREKRKKIYK